VEKRREDAFCEGVGFGALLGQRIGLIEYVNYSPLLAEDWDWQSKSGVFRTIYVRLSSDSLLAGHPALIVRGARKIEHKAGISEFGSEPEPNHVARENAGPM